MCDGLFAFYGLVGLLVFLVLFLFFIWPVVLLRSCLRWRLGVLLRPFKGTRRRRLPVLVLWLRALRRRRVLLRRRRRTLLTLRWPLLRRGRDLPVLLRRRSLALLTLWRPLLRRRVVLRGRWLLLGGGGGAGRLAPGGVRPGLFLRGGGLRLGGAPG